MKIIKGFPSTPNDDYPLHVTTILEHAVRNFPGQEIVARKGGEFSATRTGMPMSGFRTLPTPWRAWA